MLNHIYSLPKYIKLFFKGGCGKKTKTSFLSLVRVRVGEGEGEVNGGVLRHHNLHYNMKTSATIATISVSNAKLSPKVSLSNRYFGQSDGGQ